MTKKILTILLFLFCFSFAGYSEDIFILEDDEFLVELKALFSNLERQERAEKEALVDSFAAVWRDGNLMDVQKQNIVETLNKMSTLRLRASNDYPLYLKAVIAVFRTRNSTQNFEVWHESFTNLMTLRNQRRFISHLEYSLNLFNNNVVYENPTILWKYDNRDYLLKYEADTFKVEFKDGNLILYAQKDSTIIYNTDGVVLPFDEVWQGKGGRVTWERVEMNPDEVYANLSNYKVNLKTPRYDADSVDFYYKKFFEEPLFGKLSERIVAEVKPENARYPSFQSYQVEHEIKGIFPDIDFVGGFTVSGQRILGSGTDEGNAYLHFYKNDSLFISVNSSIFSIRDDRITSDRSSVSIYYSKDSIFHPVVQMRYLESKGEFYLLRDEDGASRGPFINSYHNIDMYCETLYWYKDSDEITFQSIKGFSGQGSAIFESHDFFSDMLYMKMQGIASINPIFLLRNYARDNETKTFNITDYAKYIKSDPQSTRALLLQMSYNGFIAFDHVNDAVTITDKVYHYIGAVTGKEDYDVMRIESEAMVNGRINLLNFDLHIEGISRIPLSSSKNVVLHPFGNRIIMQKNRDIYFNGRIESGLFDFFGKEFFFDYENFKIDLVNTDSLSFRVKSFEPDSRGVHTYERVRTVLEGINGELLIDNPKNKSGRLPIPRYPIFNSNNESYVYYDREYVQSGSYRRADVYFRLIPFSVDSLDNATTDNIAFDGVFISTGIFPEFTDYLTVQEDYSLGFNTHTPEEGYPVFDGKAHYTGPIDMSYEGLMANGKLEYLNSTIEANKMIMYLDSARAEVKTFSLAEQSDPVEYPEVTARDVDMLFLPFDDQLTISETKEPIELFAGLTTLYGSVSVTPTGLTGSGRMDLFGSEISADELAFTSKTFDSPDADFKLYTADGERVAFNAFNYSGHFDLNVFSGTLDGTDDKAKISFPENRFDGYGFNFDWDMEAKNLKLTNVAAPDPEEVAELTYAEIIDMDFSGYEMVSTHIAQDSLRFFAGKMDFSLEDNIIKAEEVNVIKVADAGIFPENGKVSVLKRAEIERLDNATILANTTSKYHLFYDVTAEIIARNNYRASGKYDYVDEASVAQEIYFDDIGVKPGVHTTYAKGKVFDDQGFTLSPHFEYKGDVELLAENEFMNFDGSTKIIVDCKPMQTNWFRFAETINPDSIYIPLSENLKSDEGIDLTAALVLAGDSFYVYTAFFDRTRHYLDKEIISASGYLTWNHFTREYQISTRERLDDRNLPDNFIRLNPNTCIIEGEGVVDIGSDFGQLKTKSYGTVSHNIKENKTEYDIVLGLDFFFVDDGLEQISSSVSKNKQLKDINLNRQKYLKSLQLDLAEEEYNLIKEDILVNNAVEEIPEQIQHTMFFTDIKLFWHHRTSSLVSKGDIGIGGIENSVLHKYVNGYMQIRKQRGGDVLTFLLEPVTGDSDSVEFQDDEESANEESANEENASEETEELADTDVENDNEEASEETTEESNEEESEESAEADIEDETEESTEEVAEEQNQRFNNPLGTMLGPEWYYFSYTNSIMQVIAANDDFNKTIRELKPKRRRMDVPSGETPFAFILSSDRRPFDFARVMKQITD
ncbi:MAG: hypothetical protein ACOCWC_01335 [Bacteroidota bacterium]